MGIRDLVNKQIEDKSNSKLFKPSKSFVKTSHLTPEKFAEIELLYSESVKCIEERKARDGDFIENTAKAVDHDKAWKGVISKVYKSIFEELYPEESKIIDWSTSPEPKSNEFDELEICPDEKSAESKVRTDILYGFKTLRGDDIDLLLHVEVQCQQQGTEFFGYRMFDYFTRIFSMYIVKEDKRENRNYKGDRALILAGAIYDFDGSSGKPDKFVFNPLGSAKMKLEYTYSTIDTQSDKYLSMSTSNPLRFIIEASRKFRTINTKNALAVAKAKLDLKKEVFEYFNGTPEELKAIVEYLLYLFVMKDDELSNVVDKFKGGANMKTVEDVHKEFVEDYKQQQREIGIEIGIEKGIEKTIKSFYKNGFTIEAIAKALGKTTDEIEKIVNSK